MLLCRTLQSKQYPVLGVAEESFVSDVDVGASDRASKVLAYLVALSDAEFDDDSFGTADPSVAGNGDSFEEGFASKLAIRVGTGLGRTPADDAVHELERRELVAKTTVERDGSGRPTTRWRAVADAETTLEQVYATHADELLERAGEIGDAFEISDGEATVGDDSEVTVALNWRPNGFHAPLFVAADGPYADCGIDVSFAFCRGSRAAVERLTSGTADVALVGAASLLRAQAAGAPVVPIALLYQRAATALYTTRATFGGEFGTVEQLRGRHVAMPSGSETEALCRLFLSQAGVVDDVAVVETEGEERQTLLDGDADVVTGMATDPADLRTAGHTVDSVLVADHFPVYGPALTVRRRTLVEQRPFLEAFLRATVNGWSTAVEDYDVAAEAVATRGDGSVERERRRFETAVDRFARTDATRKHGWGWQSVDGWQRLRTALRQADVLADSP